MTASRITWIRAGDRYPELADDPDYFLALDETNAEVGLVKWVEAGPDYGWFWSMTLTHEGPAFNLPTRGQSATRGQAARELGACYGHFRAWFGLDEA